MSEVRDNPAMVRFETASGDAVAFVESRREGGRIALLHTEVPDAMSGQGVGSKLVRGVLDSIQRDGPRSCPNAGSWPPTSSATRSTGT